jgi:antitoxin VapB
LGLLIERGNLIRTIFGMERSVKLLRDEEGQIVEIPSEFEFSGEDAIMRKEGDKLIIEPAPKRSLAAPRPTLETNEEEIPEIEDHPPERIDF